MLNEKNEKERKYIDLPESSFIINGNEIPYKCSCEKIFSDPGSLPEVPYVYLVECKFKDVLPLYDERMIRIGEGDVKTIRLYFDSFALDLAPPREVLPEKIYKEEFKKYIKQQIADGYELDDENYQDRVDENHSEFITEISFIAENVSVRLYDWGEEDRQTAELYSGLSIDEKERAFLMDDIYWKVKKIVGSTRVVKVNKDRTEIIGGPF